MHLSGPPDVALTEPHGHGAGVRWRLTADGIEVEGAGVERSDGSPVVVTSVWERFHEAINEAAAEHKVYCELIVATICTESGGDPDAWRAAPGWVSDEATPEDVRVGLMQTSLAAARRILGMPRIDRAWLCVPAHSVHAGAACIAQQRTLTALDPPKVACAYGAGGLYDDHDPGNRWRMRQVHDGVPTRCDRFVRWFNDAAAVLRRHARPPAYALRHFLAALYAEPQRTRR
jgi:hypothetical protein